MIVAFMGVIVRRAGVCGFWLGIAFEDVSGTQRFAFRPLSGAKETAVQERGLTPSSAARRGKHLISW